MSNRFTQSPIDRVLDEISGAPKGRGVRPAATPAPQAEPQQQAPATPREFFDGLAAETNLPPNILWAIEERQANGGALTPDRAGKTAEALRSRLEAAGGDMKTAVRGLAGDAGGEEILRRALELADTEYQTPEQAAREAARNDNMAVTDAALQAGGSVLTGAGRGIRGLGALVAGPASTDPSPEDPTALERVNQVADLPRTALRSAAKGLGDLVFERGEWIKARRSDRAQEKADAFQIEGELFDPSSWQLSEGATVEGFAQSAAQLFGELAPMILMPVAGAAAYGAGQGQDGAAEAGREVIDAAARDGTLQDIPGYQKLIAAGFSDDEATEQLRQRAGDAAGMAAAPIAGAGGALTSYLTRGGVTALASRGAIPRIAGTAAISGAEEGTQEVLEGVAGRAATGAATGADVDLAEGTAGEFAMGAVAGGALGGLGALRRREEPQDDPRLLMPPEGGSDGAPGGLIGQDAPLPDDRLITDQRGPYTARGEDPGFRFPAIEGPQATAAAPRRIGPIEEAEVAAGPAPEPEAQPAPDAPQRFPDQKPGAEIVLRDPDGRDVPVVFLREEADGVVVRDAGEELFLTAKEFDTARTEAKEPRKGGLADRAKGTIETPPAEAGAPALPDTLEETDRLIEAARAQGSRENGGMTPRILDRIRTLEAHRETQVPEPVADPQPEEPTEDRSPDADTPSPVAADAAPEAPGAPEAPAESPAPEQAEPERAAAPVPQQEGEAEAAGEVERKKNGQPFTSVDAAWTALKRRGKDLSDYEVFSEGDGFAARPRTAGGGDATTVPGPETPVGASAPAGPRVMINKVGRDGLTDAEREAGKAPLSDPAPASPPQRPSTAISPKAYWDKSDEAARRELVSEIGEPGDTARAAWADLDRGVKRRLTKAYQSAAQAIENGGVNNPSPVSEKPRAPAAPMAPAQDRVQPDMLGGPEVSENDMAAKERDRRAWGRMAGMIEGDRVADISEEIGRYLVQGWGDARLEVFTGNSLANPIFRVDVESRYQAIADLRREMQRRDAIKDRDPKPEDATPTDEGAAPAELTPYLIDAAKGGPSWRDTVKKLRSGAALVLGDVGLSMEKQDDGAYALTYHDRTRTVPFPGPSVALGDYGLQRDALDAASMFLTRMAEPDYRAMMEQRAQQKPAPSPRAPEPTPAPAPAPVNETTNASAPDISISDIRERASLLTGMGQDQKPEVGNVKFTWDGKAGGWVFSRKRADEVRDAMGVRQNDTPAPNPTEAQKEAGNYKMGHLRWNGLDISIETAKGQERRGTGPDGKEWSVTMPADYGYFRRTEGADGDHVDVYIGPDQDSDAVFVVDQQDRKTGKFDEHKVIIGTKGRGEALNLYRAGFSDGNADQRIRDISETDVAGLKAWLADGDTSEPANGHFKPVKGDPLYAEQAVPVADSRVEQKKRDARAAGKTAQKAGEDRKPPEWMAGDLADEWLAGYGEGIAEGAPKDSANVSRPAMNAPGAAPEPTRAPSPPKPPTPKAGILSSLSQEKQDRAAELKRRLAEKARNQTSSGLDPEYITLGGELVALYIEGGTRKFAQMLRDFADTTGLTMREAQAPMRAAYNHVRDDMDLNGEDVSDMDSAEQVMAEVRAALAEPDGNSTSEAPSDTVAAPTEEGRDDNGADAGDGGEGPKEGAGDPAPRPGQAGSLRSDAGQAGRTRGEGTERAGGRPEPREDGAGDRDAVGAGRGDGGTPSERAVARNHVIPLGGLTLARGEKTRARQSVAAIQTLRDIQAEARAATPDEIETMAKYGGAGTLSGTLPRSDGTIKYPDLAQQLDTLLSEDEKATLSRTSQYAFYTAESALRGMWQIAERLGFKGGRVYEPGMGVGGFAGTVPESVRGDTRYTGVELDHVTAQIAATLYPKHNIKQADFIQQKLPQGFYDLAIGNPPFAGVQIQADPDYPQRFMIHDYFFAKTLDAVRPGGILMFITSAGTMNKLDAKARDYMADRADLVGAIRLPNTAFKENGTEVTTDIVILRKRAEGEPESGPAWRQSAAVTLDDGEGGTGEAAVNQYFIDHPEMILGEQGLYDTLTAGARVGVRPKPGADLARDLAEAMERLPENVMSEADPAEELGALDDAHTEKKPGSFYLKDGDLYQFDGNAGAPVKPAKRGEKGGMPKAAIALIRDLIPVKGALRDVYAADLRGGDADAARKRLNAAYDAFVAKRGPIGKQVRQERRPSVVQQETARQQAANDARNAGQPFDIGSFDAGPMIEAGATMQQIAKARSAAREASNYREGDFKPDDMPSNVVVKRPNIDPFMDDPESYRLLAIEKYDEASDTAAKTRVFTESAVTRNTTPEINSPEDALLHVLADTGRVDLERIADLAGSDPSTVRRELEDKIFRNPATGDWETRAKYLSGNVVAKLDEAMEAAESATGYDANVEALRAVQPNAIPAEEIRVPLGAHWFDQAIYSDWAESIGLTLKAQFNRALGKWSVDGTESGSKAASDHGTEDLPFGKLMALVFNNKKIEVRRKPKDAPGYVDDTATQAAQDKAQELKEQFTEWLWSDKARADNLERIYNRTFNAEVAPSYDGGYLTTPGIHSDWRWRPHQTSVVARILQSGNTYMAHTVGAGKTSAMIGAGMEARRLGLAKKPMYVVPNHMLVQFSTEFYQQYPLAKILVADERKFEKSRRRQFIADAALGDYDAIILTHSAFEKVPPSEEARKAAVKDMLADLKEVVEKMDGDDRGADQSLLGALRSVGNVLGVDAKGISGEKGVSTRKKIERLLEAAEQRMQRQMSVEGRDQVFDFEEIGVDMLFVDEAHEFRKLSFATQHGNLKGIDPAGSDKSMDLFVKARGIEQKNPGRGLIFASGTPVTNTMAELYSISRYLQPQALAERGLSAFDAWAATFGTTESALEQNPDGSYKMVARFAKFLNTPELSLMVRQVMDVVSSTDLEKLVTRPKLKNGRRTHVVVEGGNEVKAYQADLSGRMAAIAKRKGPVKKGDDILLSVIGDGRLSAIDMRLVDPSSRGVGSKLERMISNVARVWKDGAAAPLHGVKPEGGYTDKPVETGPSTQIIFSTLGINGSRHNPDFSVHRFIKAQLIAQGVPVSEIVLAEDIKDNHARKQRAFMDMNEGKKRILIGSKSIFTGVNAQRRLAAVHNLDPLWYPADDEQRNGRALRQGNMNPEIEIFDYSTKGTYDATMWQMMGRKAAFIEAFFRGDPNVREIEDLGEASAYEQAKAVTTSDPRVLELTELKAERDTLERRKKGAKRAGDRLRGSIRSLERWRETMSGSLGRWREAAKRVEPLA